MASAERVQVITSLVGTAGVVIAALVSSHKEEAKPTTPVQPPAIYNNTTVNNSSESKSSSSDSSTKHSAAPDRDSKPEETWHYMGKAVTGESVYVKEPNGADFEYKIGGELVVATADCSKGGWWAAGYGWREPQSEATSKMMEFVCK